MSTTAIRVSRILPGRSTCQRPVLSRLRRRSGSSEGITRLWSVSSRRRFAPEARREVWVASSNSATSLNLMPTSPQDHSSTANGALPRCSISRQECMMSPAVNACVCACSLCPDVVPSACFLLLRGDICLVCSAVYAHGSGGASCFHIRQKQVHPFPHKSKE